MRRLGLGLMIAGLIAALAAVMFAELGSAAASDRARFYLDWIFYAGAAACVLGIVIFLVRVFIARRRSEPYS